MNILAFLCLIHIAIKREAKWINSVLLLFNKWNYRKTIKKYWQSKNIVIYYGKKEKRLSLENGVVFDMKKERIKYITIFAITFILEVIIAKYVHDKIIRPYIGDVLVVICLYTFAKSIFLDKIKLLSLYVLILAVIVEILQYFNYAQILFGDNKIAKTLLGSSFDIKDILCYVVGYLIIILIEKISHERKEAKQNENSR